MNIPEAIEILTQYLPTHRWPPNKGLESAMKLGIEALEHIQEERQSFFSHRNPPLPGETED